MYIPTRTTALRTLSIADRDDLVSEIELSAEGIYAVWTTDDDGNVSMEINGWGDEEILDTVEQVTAYVKQIETAQDALAR